MGTRKFADLSMCWNAVGVERFKFSQTMDIQDGFSMLHAADWTATVARGAPGGRLKALVVNSHAADEFLFYRPEPSSFGSAGGGGEVAVTVPGSYGLLIGDGINLNQSSTFAPLKGLVDEIYIYACSVAAKADPGQYAASVLNPGSQGYADYGQPFDSAGGPKRSPSKAALEKYLEGLSGDGEAFCQKIANVTGAVVTAGTVPQDMTDRTNYPLNTADLLKSPKSFKPAKSS